MRCEQCRRNKIQELFYYGGIALCFTCNEIHNPITDRVYKLSEEQVWNKKAEISKLNSRIRLLKKELILNEKVISSNSDYINTIILRKRK